MNTSFEIKGGQQFKARYFSSVGAIIVSDISGNHYLKVASDTSVEEIKNMLEGLTTSQR